MLTLMEKDTISRRLTIKNKNKFNHKGNNHIRGEIKLENWVDRRVSDVQRELTLILNRFTLGKIIVSDHVLERLGERFGLKDCKADTLLNFIIYSPYKFKVGIKQGRAQINVGIESTEFNLFLPTEIDRFDNDNHVMKTALFAIITRSFEDQLFASELKNTYKYSKDKSASAGPMPLIEFREFGVQFYFENFQGKRFGYTDEDFLITYENFFTYLEDTSGINNIAEGLLKVYGTKIEPYNIKGCINNTIAWKKFVDIDNALEEVYQLPIQLRGLGELKLSSPLGAILSSLLSKHSFESVEIVGNQWKLLFDKKKILYIDPIKDKILLGKGTVFYKLNSFRDYRMVIDNLYRFGDSKHIISHLKVRPYSRLKEILEELGFMQYSNTRKKWGFYQLFTDGTEITISTHKSGKCIVNRNGKEFEVNALDDRDSIIDKLDEIW